MHPLHVGSSPSEAPQEADERASYEDRKKFWEEMTTSQSSDSGTELRSRERAEPVSKPEKVRTPEDVGFVKNLTEIYSEKIAAGEIVMPAIPRPKSGNLRDLIEPDGTQQDGTVIATYLRKEGSSDTSAVLELEAELEEETMITEKRLTHGSSVDSEKEFLYKYGEESVAFDNSGFLEEDEYDPSAGDRKVSEETFRKRPPPVSLRKSIYERSMSLPAEDVYESTAGAKAKKRSFEAEMKKEIVVEQLMTQVEEECSTEHKSIREYATETVRSAEKADASTAGTEVKTTERTEIKETAATIVDDLLVKGAKMIGERAAGGILGKVIQKVDSTEVKQKSTKKEEEAVPAITVTLTGKKQTETASLGESEDTQSESDVTPEDARVVDNGEAPWDASGTQSGGISPKDDFDIIRDRLPGETGIGRWIGQEDLSQQIWEKEDIDSSCFKMETKWERTRSESASPKEPFVCTPEEHYPDTVWEVPVQEHLESEEITHDIPIEKQVIIEKDEEEEEEEEEEKPQKEDKITEEEAREIAEEVLEYIELEVENRASILITDIDDLQEPRNQVTEYLRQLAGEKNLDDDEIQLIQSVLAQKHKDQMMKLRDKEIIGSSQEITDEDLRSTEAETDTSPVESQMERYEVETDEPKTKDEDMKKLRDVEIVDRTIAEVKESLEAAQEELIEQRKKKQNEILKKESPSEFEFKGINIDRKYDHGFDSSEWRSMKDYETIDEEGDRTTEKIESTTRSDLYKEEIVQGISEKVTKITEASRKDTEIDESVEKKEEIAGLAKSERVTQISDKAVKDSVSKSDMAERTLKERDKTGSEVQEISDEFIRIEKHHTENVRDEHEEAQRLQKESTLETRDERTKDVTEHVKERTVKEEKEESSSESETKSGGVTERVQSSHKTFKTEETTMTTFKSVSSEEKLKELEIPPEGIVLKKFGAHAYSSEDSPRSVDDTAKSSGGEEVLSSSPSVERRDVTRTEIKMRQSKGLLPKGDRKSGTDLEPYSSSGESHYHSCELVSSRPCSSDVEALIAGVGGTGSSEYESALSQISSRQTTSGDYHTAVSSLSSRESIKSLDSESSGHLASIEISSEASETLIPSASELDKDLEMSGAILLDDDSPDMMEDKKTRPPPQYVTQTSAPAAVLRRSVDEDFEVISESEIVSWTGEVSEDEGTEAATAATEDMVVDGEDRPQKMKRSHEMTFQPEPRPIVVSGSVDTPSEQATEKFPYGSSVDESITSNQDDKFGSSLEETGSILSMSLSTASETSAVRTVIEQHHTDSEKMDASLTISGTSVDSGSREEIDNLPLTQEMSTSTVVSSLGKKTASVTITTSTANDQGITSVSTQVTSVSRKSSMVDEAKSDSDSSSSRAKPHESVSQANGPTQVDYVPEYDEIESTKSKKSQGHRRKESTSSFVPTMRWTVTQTKTVKRDSREDDSSEESEKYAGMLTEKEVKNDEKKEADDSEKPEESTEDEPKDLDGRRPVSSVPSEDQPDSEFSDLVKQGSSETEPFERPATPEPEEFENKDDTPEFSSEAQASVTELEMEYSGAYSRRDEYASHVSPIREEKVGIQYPEPDMTDRAEIDSVAHSGQLPAENIVAEKHELETREKEITKKMREDASPGDIPDITVTEHMTPLLDRNFHYPDLENEERERKATQSTTPDTDVSSRASSSTSTDQGREYVLEDVSSDRVIKEDSDMEDKQTEFSVSVTDRTVLERSVIQEEDEEASDSPNSDSFEMLDKPDITDEYVIIEEVGREAQEHDQEGKGVRIDVRKRKPQKKSSEEKEEELIPSPPAPATKMTDLRYYPGDEDAGPFQFESDSPPVATSRQVDRLKKKSSKEEESDSDVDQQIEENKKWMEMQFQGEQAAKIIGYPYEMEGARGFLEDIKEEEYGELDSSSKIGSMGSQKESIGSFGSVKDSFSSTPDYELIAGKKFFTRSGDHDDVSMSSLQEFELIEKKILLENGKKSGSSSSQDSLSSKKLGTSSKSGQGDDLSVGSLREFENLEKACVTVVKMERKAKEEEAILSEIDEGHESQISESESCETVSGVVREKPESDTEDFDKRMFEIDEIIRQAQTNVERFADLRALDKTESVGRGDSLEEVAKVPDLELDAPLYGKSSFEQRSGEKQVGYSTQVVTKKKVQQWRESELSEGSDLLEPKSKVKSVSSDSLETRTSERFDTISMDSFDMQLDRLKTKTESIGDGSDIGDRKIPDLMEDEEAKSHEKGRESSSSGRDGDYSSSGREDAGDHQRPPPRADFMLGSTDSLDPSSSTATHATYQYETDSVMSSSFTSGGSNTMVSSMDNLAGIEDFGTGKTGVWFETVGVPGTEPFVTEIIEPLEDGTYSHIVHRRTETVPDAKKIVFRGPDAEKSLQGYLESLPPEEEVTETREEDEHGNIHVRKVVRRRVVLRPGEEPGATGAFVETLRTGRTDPIVSETIYPSGEEGFSHTIHRSVEMAPDVKKIVFRGPDADRALEEFVEGFDPGEEVVETEEVDEDGNVHVKRVVQRRLVMTSDEARGMTGSQIADYFRNFGETAFAPGQQTRAEGDDPRSRDPRDPPSSLGQSLTRAHVQQLRLTGKEDDDGEFSSKGTAKVESQSSAAQKEADEGEIDQQLDRALETPYTGQKKQ
ncbi:UNVERIFIED_CONTAM: hypothetical protein PYX00_002435 [Menopon gallinae]|uniref:Uncharacterized protein n=1 Tax=Menopon gallinae TaxID=328185 RepID=A0AAW2IGT3_9NEOP